MIRIATDPRNEPESEVASRQRVEALAEDLAAAGFRPVAIGHGSRGWAVLMEREDD